MGTISTSDGAAPPRTAAAVEDRVRTAALGCIARHGITRMTVDDVAREAGVARATLYRAFPGGKGTLVEAVLGRELHRFFAALADEPARHVDAQQLPGAWGGRSLRFFDRTNHR